MPENQTFTKMERMDLNRVATFVKIVEAGGVTAAATKLKLPKSSVSRSLTQLEQELGMELLVRGHRQLILSEAGRSFFEAASKGLSAVEEARDGLRDQHRTPSGLVRLAIPPDIGTLVLAPTLAQFVRDYPEVELEVSTSTRPVDPIRDGFDLVVTTGVMADSSLIARPLGKGDLGIFASEAYLQRRGTPRSPADLANHDCVLYRPALQKMKWVLSRETETEHVMVTGSLRVDNLFLVVAMAAAGAGLALLPVHLRLHPSTQGLVRVLPDYAVAGEPVQLVYPAARHTPLRVKLLCDAIVKGTSACPRGSVASPRVASKRKAPEDPHRETA